MLIGINSSMIMESLNSSESVQVAQRQLVIPHQAIFTILTYVIATSIILVNGSILLAFLVQKIRRPSQTRLSPAGLLVLNLLVADASVGVDTIVMTATETDTMAATKWCCTLRVAFSYLVLIGSHVALINVATDRYVAILHTLHYRDWMTMSRSIAMILCGWLVPVAGFIGAILSNDWQPGFIVCEQLDAFRYFLSYVWVPSHGLALVFVVVIQCRVYLRLRLHETTLQTTNNVLQQYSKKSVQMLYRITTTFVLCWGPFDIVLLMIIVWPNTVLKIIYDMCAILAHVSFLVNPCMYSYKTENIRKPVSALLSDIKAALGFNKANGAPQANGGRSVNTVSTRTSVSKSTSGKSLTKSTSLEGIGHM